MLQPVRINETRRSGLIEYMNTHGLPHVASCDRVASKQRNLYWELKKQ